MNLLEVKINPETNNLPYIESKFNLAKGYNVDISFEVLNWKVKTFNKMKEYAIFQKDNKEINVWNESLRFEITDLDNLIEYVANFCKRTYEGCNYERMLEIIKSRNIRAVITEMIEPRSKSVWRNERENAHELNFDDGIEVRFPECDYRMPLIRVEAFFDKLLDINDDFAQEANEILYSLKKDNSQDVIDILKEKYDDNIDDDCGYMTVKGYTYNSENDFNRDFTYHIFEYNGDSYVFITVHYGADARVGFGSMVCFKILDIDYFFIWSIQVWDSKTDDDFTTYDLEEIANYDIETDTWTRKDNGNELNLYTVANGF